MHFPFYEELHAKAIRHPEPFASLKGKLREGPLYC